MRGTRVPSGMGFEVEIPELPTGAKQLHGDAEEVRFAGSGVAGATHSAGGACGGALLARSLGGFTARLRTCCTGLADAAAKAGDALGENARRYEEDDGAAAAGLGGSFGEGGWGP